MTSKSTLPKRLISDLFKYSSHRNQSMSPLMKEIANLNKQLSEYKRASALMQVRRTIGRLVLELPKSFCDDPSPSVRWPKLWNHIWDNAKNDSENPLYETWHRGTGEKTRQDVQNIGFRLYKDMSSEIHNYKEFRPEAFQCFDGLTRDLANNFSPRYFNRINNSANWKREIRRYYIEDTKKETGAEQEDEMGLDYDKLCRAGERGCFQEPRNKGKSKQSGVREGAHGSGGQDKLSSEREGDNGK